MEKQLSKREARVLRPVRYQVAGIDVGAGCHYVCVGNLSEESVRRFGTFTEDMEALADWLVGLKVESVAMESTGIYWVNLYDVLENRGVFGQCALCTKRSRP